MRYFAMLCAVAMLGACTGRQVEVTTNPAPATSQATTTLRVTSTLTQPVNVYVVVGTNELFVRQVAARSTEQAVVRGVAPGTEVTLRARPVDGRQVYEKAGVRLDPGVIEWSVP